jgi:H+/gluconate symporter-like permease
MYILALNFEGDMAKVKSKIHKKQKKSEEKFLPFKRQNYIIFSVGIFLIILGYFALAQGPYDSFSSLSVAPVLLVIGYCIVIPFAILYRGGKTESAETSTEKGD